MADVGNINAIDQLYMFTKVGTVVGNQNWSETSISTTTTSSGGGGYIHQGSGFISSPTSSTTTSSSTTEKLRLFVREDDGDEFEVKFSEPGFGVREGHRVSIVYAGDQASQAGYPMSLVNHSTSNQKIFSQRAEWIVKRIGGGMGCGLFAAIPIVAYLLTQSPAMAIVGLLISGGWLFWKHREANALVRAIVKAVTDETAKAVAAGKAARDKG